MIEPLQLINASKIVTEILTDGSSPLQIVDSLGNSYYAKTTTTNIPYQELINEVLCAYFLQLWDLKVPTPCVINISDEVVDNYIQEIGALSNRYNFRPFADRAFFGSKVIWPLIELETYFTNLSGKKEYNLFLDPLDLIKIGVFDLWIGNMDRKPENPNIILGTDGDRFCIHPIDHTAAFAHVPNLNGLRPVLLHLAPHKNILSSTFAKSIIRFAPSDELRHLKDQILLAMNDVNSNIIDIFDQVPPSWGFSKKAKTNLSTILADPKRNAVVAAYYLNFI